MTVGAAAGGLRRASGARGEVLGRNLLLASFSSPVSGWIVLLAGVESMASFAGTLMRRHRPAGLGRRSYHRVGRMGWRGGGPLLGDRRWGGDGRTDLRGGQAAFRGREPRRLDGGFRNTAGLDNGGRWLAVIAGWTAPTHQSHRQGRTTQDDDSDSGHGHP